MINEEWVFNEEFDKAGLTVEEAGLLNILKGLCEPSGFCQRFLTLEHMFPGSKAKLDKLEEVIKQYDFKKTVRIHPSEGWWFPCRWSEKLGKSFNPESNKQMRTFSRLLNAGIHPSEVPYVNWRGLENIPLERLQEMYSDDLIDVIREKEPYAFPHVKIRKGEEHFN